MTTTTEAWPETMREQVGDLLTRLRGEESRSAMARRLGISRQTHLQIEGGSVSLEKLDQLSAAYGVRFALVALDPTTLELHPASVAQLGALP